MAQIIWDTVGERFYETGVEKGVLYIPNASGVYDNGVAWNGLQTVTESPTGAEANAQYADNIKYLNLYSIEEFGCTIEALTYPREWEQFDGLTVPQNGVTVGQQPRKQFGLSYQTKIGNDITDDLGYKIHLVYGCKASASEKAYSTVNDSPEPIAFSWEVMTTPVSVTNQKPTALITIDSRYANAAGLTALTNILYGASANPKLPLPDEVIALLSATPTTVTASALTAAAPTFNATTGVVTITAVTGIVWKLSTATVTNLTVPAGATVPATVGPASGGGLVRIEATPTPAGTHAIAPLAQTSWTFART